MGNYKWNNNDSNRDLPYVVVLMISRNKDNAHVAGFKERKRSYFCTKDMEKIRRKFKAFVDEGIEGEMSRLYISLNARDPEKVRKKLLHLLIDEENIVFDYIEAKIAGLAAEKDCAAEKKWFFDFDLDDLEKANEFVNDIKNIDPNLDPRVSKTPNGMAISVQNGFDTRALFSRWNRDEIVVSLKRDDLICYDWDTKK